MNGESPRLSRLFPLVLFLLATALACPAFSADINTLLMRAGGGDAKAQYSLGGAYFKGKNVPQNHAEAMKWFRKAAEQGHAKAQFLLGVGYYKGMGVQQNHSEAVKWYRKSAEQGYAHAQCNLGVAYHDGLGVPQDYAEAVRWYRKAAEQGDAYAQTNLGNAYKKGNGVPQDYELAYFWYSLSASNRKGEDHDRSAKARDESAMKLTPDQIGKVQQMTREWAAKHHKK
ncbi:sel1 repeat family protein [Candidatus Poribacteria bacterium]|nr:sel1 repeat family protein [Candidatus Poribacteria bacterium]